MPKPKKNLSQTFSSSLKNEVDLVFIKHLLKKFPELDLFLVGGMVRDIIMGNTISKDFDFVARGVQIRDLITELNKLGWCDLTGRDFGVIKYKPQEGSKFIDIALPRSEKGQMTGGYHDFNLKVDPALPVEEDLARRDLTINAMAWDIKNSTLIDPFKGQEDIDQKVIRTVGKAEARFQEDYSRILRALRFACQFNFNIESQTWATLIKLAPSLITKRQLTKEEQLERRLAQEIIDEQREKLLQQLNDLSEEQKKALIEEEIVPIETISREFFKTLLANPRRAAELYDESGLLKIIIPELISLKGCEQPEKFHSEGDVWTHTLMLLDKISDQEFSELFPDFKISGAFIFGCLLHDIGKPVVRSVDDSVDPPKIKFYGHAEEGVAIAKKICARLKLSSDTQEKIVFMIKNHMFALSAPSVYKFRAHSFAERFIDNQHSPDLLALFYLDCSCSLGLESEPNMKNVEETLLRIEEIKNIRAHQPGKIISGSKIIEILDLAPGPIVACLLNLIEELKDQGKINRSGDAEKFLRDNYALLKKLSEQAASYSTSECTEKILKDLNL